MLFSKNFIAKQAT